MTDTQIKIERSKAHTCYENKKMILNVSKLTKMVGLIYQVSDLKFGTVSIDRNSAAQALRDMRKASK
jgi:hypothetical protein